jgi:WD40 repeat protein
MLINKRFAFAAILGIASSVAASEPSARLTIQAHKDTVRCVAFSPDGKMLATGGYDFAVRLWSLPMGTERATLKGHSGNLLSVAFTPDGKTLSSGAVDSARIWDVATCRETFKLEGKDVLSVAFSPAGDRLAIGGTNGGSVKIFDVAKGKQVDLLEGQAGDDVVFAVSYSPDGGMIAVASLDLQTNYGKAGNAIKAGNGATITLWNLTPGKPATVARRFKGIIGAIWSVEFSPNGKILAAATEEKTVRLWDVASGQEREPLRGHTNIVHGVAFSPDGKRLASASMDQTLMLWDTQSGKRLATLKGHTSAVKCVAFSPDGESLASGSWDGTAKIWNVGK